MTLTFTGTNVLQFDAFDDPCSMTKWTSRWKTETISNGILEITGETSWQASVVRYREFSPGQGIALRFKFARGSEFEMSFDNGLWNTDRYRRFGLNLRADAAQAIVWQGATGIHGENLTGNLYPQPDSWYDLLMAQDRQGEFIVEIRDPREPLQSLQYRGRIDTPEPASSWLLGIGADKGKLSIDDFADIALGR